MIARQKQQVKQENSYSAEYLEMHIVGENEIVSATKRLAVIGS